MSGRKSPRWPLPVQAGERFARLLVVSVSPGRFAHCRCDCGVERTVPMRSLRSGNTRSCGCLQRDKAAKRAIERNTIHGGSRTPLFRIWSNMITRCTNAHHEHWASYGGRGIAVCPRWRKSFVAFRDDIGPRPSAEHSLDRIDNDGDYEPGNVRWATACEQAQNKRTSVRLTFRGTTRTVSEWSRIAGMPVETLNGRLHRGWSVERALTEPTDLYHHGRRRARANVLERAVQEVG